ncbi:MAG: spermidine synthase [Kiritimatiellales bacterium]|jgi:spermidine synthase
MNFYNPILSTGQAQRIALTRMLYQKQTAFQKIEVFDTAEFGRCLAIDGLIQATENDHHLYDAAFTSAITEVHRRVLILGGGDGFVAQAALAKNPHLKITVVEIDTGIVGVARDFFQQMVFEDARVELVISDAGEYLRQGEQTLFDVIFFDLTDNPLCGNMNAETFSAFYTKAFQNASVVLAPGGQVVVQAGASHVTDAYLDSAKILHGLMSQHFAQVQDVCAFIPSFGEKCSFLYAH